jgi:pterin-4a-carbinolamine dehydratase
VTLTLSTHSEGGISQKDFDLAARIEQEPPKQSG